MKMCFVHLTFISAAIVLLFAAISAAESPLTSRPATDPLKIDCNFPGGAILVDHIDRDDVYLRLDFRECGPWFHWHFRVTGAPGRTLRFHLLQNAKHMQDGRVVTSRGPCISTDGGLNWQWLGKNSATLVKQRDDVDNTFQYTFAPTATEVRFSLGIPYLQTDWQRFMQKLANNPAMKPGVLCQSKHGRDVEMLEFGRLDGQVTHRVLFTARHHACESTPGYVIEGLIEAALADDELGRWYRANVECLVVPFMDKDGVEEGLQGKTRPYPDYNNAYAPDEPIYPEVAALKKLVPTWADGKLKVMLDLHCPLLLGNYQEMIHLWGTHDPEQTALQNEFVKIGETVTRESGGLMFNKIWPPKPATQPADGAPRRPTSPYGWVRTFPSVIYTDCVEIAYGDVQGKEVTAQSARAFGHDLAKIVRIRIETLRGQ